MADTDFRIKNGFVVNNSLFYSASGNTLYHGNSVANGYVNSAAIAVREPAVSAVINSTALTLSMAGSTQSVAAATWSVGNSTANVSGNTIAVVYSNATVSTVLSIGDLKLGNSSVNAHANASQISIKTSTSANILSDHDIEIGNATVIGSISMTAMLLSNTAAPAVIAGPGTISVGNSTINAFMNSVEFAVVNSTVSTTILSSSITAGNGSISTIANSTALTIAGQTATANVATKFGLSGGPLVGPNPTLSISTIQPPRGLGMAINAGLKATVSANVLTVTLTDSQGNSPSNTNPVLIQFRRSPVTQGNSTCVAVTANLSISTAPNGNSTFGTIGSAFPEPFTPFRLWVCAHNVGGNAVISLIRTSEGVVSMQLAGIGNRFTTINETTLNSAFNILTATKPSQGTIGVFYATQDLSLAPTRILGYMDWSNGLTTEGKYDTGPDIIQVMGPGVPFPGDILQTATANQASGSTTTSAGVFIGNPLAVNINMTAHPNLVMVHCSGNVECETNINVGEARLYLDSAQDASWTTATYIDTTANVMIAGCAIQTLRQFLRARAGGLSHLVQVYYYSDNGHRVDFPSVGGEMLVREIMG